MTTTLTLNQADPTATVEAPVKALRLAAGPLRFAAGDTSAEKDQSSREINLLARTSSALYHWYWGWIVHDFEGMQHKDKIVLDYCHCENDLVGFADKFTISADGLMLGGRIESIDPDDEAAKILKRADKGIPYEASIYFEPESLEYVPEGFKTNVNGLEMSGPLTVVRKWRLRACAVCPHGYDVGTDAQLSADKAKTFALTWKKETAMTATNQAQPQSQPEKPAIELSVAPAIDPRDELKKFTDRFGAADGAIYYGGKLSYEQALEKHVEKLSTAVETESKRAVEAETKLTAAKLSLGETGGIDTGAKGTDGKSSKSFGSLIRARDTAK